MLIHIQNLLTADDLSEVQNRLQQAEFIDGKATAGAVAARVKQNLQLEESSREARDAGQIVLDALRNNRAFCAAVRPKAMLVPLFCRYEPGMHYGEHLDNPIMGGSVQVRTDVSVTVFLSDLSGYEGGELVVRTESGVQQFRGNAGDAFAYPSNLFHQVNRVTKGVRHVAVTWVQSIIRDDAQRRILFDLGQVIESLQKENANHACIPLTQKCQMNLTRMWAEV